ncbi:MAG: adenylate/guanylate cyclase domain-containing protein [Solirubrobacteraceae bacterium]
MAGSETYALPEDPALADVAAAMQAAGHWGWVLDDRWRIVFVTDELRLTFGGDLALADFPVGAHFFGPQVMAASRGWRFGMTTVELARLNFAALGGWVLADTPGGREELRRLVDPTIADMVESLMLDERPALWYAGAGMGLFEVGIPAVGFRIRDGDGRLAGTVVINKPAAGMATLGAMTSMASADHLRRMLQVAKPGRRPAAILFADLEASSALSRRLSTARYFAFGRRLATAADRCTIDAGGLPGRHVGDGVVAFFLAETAGSESAAARACITAARALRDTLHDVAVRSDLEPQDAVLRLGLHWGSTLYVGSITTGGRSEVTALGDEVNEAARIEACAAGGLTLASKSLIERLEPGDAAALDLHPDTVSYAALGNLAGATEKARRDAPAIAVCQV